MAYIQNVDEIVQVTPTEDYPEIYLSQNENGRVLRLYVAGDDFPSGSTATLSGTKPDGIVYSASGTVSGNTVTINENIQMTAVAGRWFAKLRIINGGNTLATIKIRIIVDEDPVRSGSVPSDSVLDGIIAEAAAYAEDARSAAYGSPLTAATASAMTDNTKVYVYTGSESGYTAGHWYYWNGSAWTDGGVYNAVAVQTDKTLTVEDKAADAKATGYAIDNRNAPSADQLISDNYTIDQTPYLYRQTNSNGADRAIEEIVGGSVAWNQIAGNFSNRAQTLGMTITADNTNGSITVSGTATATNNLWFRQGISVVTGHKYLLRGAKTSGIKLGITGTSVVDSGNGMIINAVSQYTSVNLLAYFENAQTYNETLYPQLFDLTAMFGSTIADYIYNLEQSSAGAGVAFFRKLFPEDYYAYDAGTMMHVSGVSAKETVGKNLFGGYTLTKTRANEIININTGSITAISTASGSNNQLVFSLRNLGAFRGKNIRFSITDYNKSSSVNPYIVLYCGVGTSEVFAGSLGNPGSGITRLSFNYTVPENATYLNLVVRINQGTASANDYVALHGVMLTLSEADETFKPYEKHTYPLDSSLTLRGVPKLDSNNQLYFDGDTYESDGTVTRKYGIVDLGTLTWNYVGAATYPRFYSISLNNTAKPSANESTIANIICTHWISASISDGVNGRTTNCISVYRTGDNTVTVAVHTNDYTTAASFKSAMSGVYLVYELATPTTETAEPYTNPQIVDPYGTEEFVSTSIVPVGHYTKYPENLRAKLENLDLSIIAPIETGTAASQAYAVGKYFLLNNKFCKAKTAIASGATFTLNTNYTVTTIADELYTALH